MLSHLLKKVLAHPLVGRATYDIAIAFFFVAIVSLFYLSGFLPGNVDLGLVLAPLLLVLSLFACGLYTTLKVSRVSVKIAVVGAALAVTVATMILFSFQSLPMLLWAAFAFLPLILPRIFLNLKRGAQTSSLISRTVGAKGPVLVVGGAGYIGTHVVEQLLKAGQSVRVLDSLIYGQVALKDFIGNPRFELVDGDATNIVKLNTAMNGVSAVVHLAGLVGDPACSVDEDFTRHTNIIATRMVREVAKSFGVPRLIFASSCSVYGVSDVPVNETSELSPVSLYARTKIDSENELLLAQTDDFVVTILRFATVFGFSRRPRFDLVVNLFTAQAWVDGVITLAGPSQWRPFVHVRDLARAVVATLKADQSKVQGQIFNVGDDRLNMTIGALAELVKNKVSQSRDVKIVENKDFKDFRNYAVSFKKIQSTLGFKAETTVEMGIEELAEEFRKGTLTAYKEKSFSNVEMTKVALEGFNDPAVRAGLYSPMSN